MSAPVFHWFLPTSGDGRDVADMARSTMSSDRGRGTDIEYLSQVARAVDNLGFAGMLTPVGSYCEDSWVTGSMLARETRNVKFLIAVRTGAMVPSLCAQMASTFQHMTGDRLGLQIVTGGDEPEMHRFGDWEDKDTRYARTGEFIQIFKGALSEPGFSFKGEHYHIENSRILSPPAAPPPVYFGGASPAAEEIAARHADVYFMWGEPPEKLAERIERMRALAARYDRTLRFGIRLQVITRDTADEAIAETERLLADIPDASVTLAQRRMRKMSSVGQQRINDLHGGDKTQLWIAPNMWAGIALLRVHGSTALVGSHEEVAERIRELHAIGFDEIMFGGLPHLEEAYRFAEGVLPLFADEAPASVPAASTAASTRFAA